MTADQTYKVDDYVNGDDIPGGEGRIVKVNKKTVVIELSSDGNHIHRHSHKHNFQRVQGASSLAASQTEEQ